MKMRKSGILLHITSLPSSYGIGDLGPEAYRFVDFLADAAQGVWQVLPLNPASDICGNSPYCSSSAFAGSPLLISLDLLVEYGLLSAPDLEALPDFQETLANYTAAAALKQRLLRAAYERIGSSGEMERDLLDFRRSSAHWLDDYTLFVALKDEFNGVAWSHWPEDVRDRREEVLAEWRAKLADRISFEEFCQYLFYKQWHALKSYCNRKNVRIVGDIPIYVSYDSCDVWAHPEIFELDERKLPISVAGVPPDYFSATGQLWGNPVYRWDELQRTRYSWWLERFEHNLALFDTIRLDHFRGFVSYWEVPASEETAVNGRWVKVPAWDFFKTLSMHFPCLPLIAEDLGIITADVREIMSAFDFPGMKLLLFAFGDELATNPYVPHNHTPNSVVYTGTHDNNTVRGWFAGEASREEKESLFKYAGRWVAEDEVHWEMIRLAMMSVSSLAVIPLQDVLGLGEEARMNMPSVTYGNWRWRLAPEQITPDVTRKLSELTRTYGRA